MKSSEKYSKSLKDKWVIRLKTHHPDGDNYDGVVFVVKRSFVAIRELRDFEFDGVIVLPKKAIRGFRDGVFEAADNAIIRNNGQIDAMSIPSWVEECGTIQHVMAYMMRHDIWPGVEILFEEGRTAAFYLGPIVKADADSFTINCYDAAGNWEKPYRLGYEEVFRIEFDSKYCNHFNNYMQAHNE
jgi:hypothetical protein